MPLVSDVWVRDREEFDRLGADPWIQRHLSQVGPDGLRAELECYLRWWEWRGDLAVRLQAVVEAANPPGRAVSVVNALRPPPVALPGG
jgi:hypothetical protein